MEKRIDLEKRGKDPKMVSTLSYKSYYLDCFIFAGTLVIEVCTSENFIIFVISIYPRILWCTWVSAVEVILTVIFENVVYNLGRNWNQSISFRCICFQTLLVSTFISSHFIRHSLSSITDQDCRKHVTFVLIINKSPVIELAQHSHRYILNSIVRRSHFISGGYFSRIYFIVKFGTSLWCLVQVFVLVIILLSGSSSLTINISNGVSLNWRPFLRS